VGVKSDEQATSPKPIKVAVAKARERDERISFLVGLNADNVESESAETIGKFGGLRTIKGG
jgi:hypothetical protein